MAPETERGWLPSVEAWQGLNKDENQPLRALYVMVFLEVGGFAMCLPIISFFAIKELGLTPSQLGFVVSCNAATQLIGAWACGRLSDSVGRRWLLLGSYGWSCLGVGASAFVYNFTQLLVLRTLQGLSGGTLTLSQAYILDWLPQAERPAYIALFGTIVGAAFLCGNVAGLGLLAVGLQRRTIFLVAAFFCLLATLYGCATIKESLDPTKRRPLCGHAEESDESTGKAGESDWEVVGIGLACVWTTRFLQALAWAVMLGTYAFLIDDLFGWSDMHLGAMMAAAGFVYAILQFGVFPLFGQHGQRGLAAALLVASISGVCAALLLPVPLVLPHLLGILLLTCTGALIAPAIPVLVALFAGNRHIGFANGIAQGCEKGAGIVGPIIGGLLYEISVPIMFSFGIVCFIFCAVCSGGAFVSKAPVEDDEECKPIKGVPAFDKAKA